MCFPKNFEGFKKIYFAERRQTATSQTSSKNDISSTGQVFSTDEEILRKKTNMVSNRPELNVKKKSISSGHI